MCSSKVGAGIRDQATNARPALGSGRQFLSPLRAEIPETEREIVPKNSMREVMIASWKRCGDGGILLGDRHLE